MKKLLGATLITLFAFSSSAAMHSLPFTQTDLEYVDESKTYDVDYHTISEITVEEVEIGDELVWAPQYKGFDKNLGEIIMVVDKLIALGKKIWTIVEAGKPVVTVDMGKPISVLPKTDSGQLAAFYDMDSWSMPMARTYKVSFKNGFGSSVIGFDYTVNFQWGGRYEYKGAYLTGLNVQASNVSVSWGFNFDASSELVSIVNHGSRDNPVAGAAVRVKYTAKSVLREIKTSESFHVTGNGQIQKLY
ncbi:hypothetical protein BIY24_07795 [Halobacteriovorax marinus]|uniref:hypothetical protein n=1 Tax=Halobacteriovorax marinus TaxID=97084 RepID=UPI000BC2F1DD|nr:hypothetical protein [Halobacteriovorax marinus]ATH07855.1 hypothetical protein BIY24_07795 [Halobacteriovorax marinus]